MNVSLPEPMKAWVESQTRDGRYANSSDYVRDLIRRDQERAQSIAELQTEIDNGMQSGDPRPFDVTSFLRARKGRD